MSDFFEDEHPNLRPVDYALGLTVSIADQLRTLGATAGNITEDAELAVVLKALSDNVIAAFIGAEVEITSLLCRPERLAS